MTPQIYQIFYLDYQKSSLEKDFIPYDNRANPRPEWCEYFVFRENFNKGICSTGHPTGFISWKFNQKTGLHGTDFHQFIRENSGADVYFINPFVDEAAFYQNLWLQGERNHPGLIELSQHIFDRVGYKIDLKSLVMPFEKSLYCNYFVGNTKFWKSFMEFCEPIYDEIENNLDPESKKFLSQRADQTIKADYRPFIFERLFSTFLCLHPEISSKSYANSPKALELRYGKESARFIGQLADLKNSSSLADYQALAARALAHPAYGPNASWLKKKFRKIIRLEMIKNPQLREAARTLRQAFKR